MDSSKRPLQRIGRKQSTEPPPEGPCCLCYANNREDSSTQSKGPCTAINQGIPSRERELRPCGLTVTGGGSRSLQAARLERAALQTGGSRCTLNGSPPPCFSPTAPDFRSKEERHLTLSVRSRSCTSPGRQVRHLLSDLGLYSQ